MYCQKCGTRNSDDARSCFSCGTVLSQGRPAAPLVGVQVPNYLIQAVLVTIFCCLPFGIPAIVYAAQVNGKIQAGDYAGASDASAKAKMWCWIAFGVGLAFTVFYMMLVVGGGIADMR